MQLRISFMQNEIGSSFRSLGCEGMLEKGCSSERHGSKSSAHNVNGKFSLASAGLRSAFAVVILKNKAEGSGEGYWQAATHSESCGRGGWLWDLESLPGFCASLFHSLVRNTTGKSYTDDRTIKVQFSQFSKAVFPTSSGHINMNPTWKGKMKDLCCAEAREVGKAHSQQEVYSKD